MRKHFRDCVGICEAAGLTVVEVDPSRRHLRIRCAEGNLTFPSTPGDTRWRQNMRSVVRRMARGVL